MLKISLPRRLVLSVFAASIAAVASVPLTAFAYDEASTSAINLDAKQIALKGYDAVAYFSVGAPTLGNAHFSAKHGAATYHFANAENRAKFIANPEHFAPQFGGFCAMGVALEKKLDGDPQAWRVVDNKLYLNVNKDIQKKWLENVPGNLKTAQENWPTIKDKTPNSL
jgi:YHS domain-containing protein